MYSEHRDRVQSPCSHRHCQPQGKTVGITHLLSRCCATGATQGTVGLEDQSQQGVYSLKGCYKPAVAVGGEATALHRVPWSVAPSDLLCFPHDTGNNWWKSQLLRVLPKRSLHSDKAAQVLAAQGTHHLLPRVLPDKGVGRGCLAGLQKVWSLPGRQLAFSCTLTTVGSSLCWCRWIWVLCSPLSRVHRQELWFPMIQTSDIILGHFPGLVVKGTLALQSLLRAPPFHKGLIDK